MNSFFINRVIGLATSIVQGHVSLTETRIRLKILNVIFHPINIPYDLCNEETEEYLFELRDVVYMGIYSKEIMLKMASIAENLYRNKIGRWKLLKIIGIIVCVIIIGCI